MDVSSGATRAGATPATGGLDTGAAGPSGPERPQRQGGSIAAGLIWITSSNILSLAVRPVTMLVMARLLTPADYGVMAVAAMLLEVLRQCKDFGIGQAYIQYRGDDKEMLNVAFWLQLVIGVVLTVIVWAFAEPVAWVFQKPEAAPVVRFLGVSFLLYPFGDAPLNLMLRRLDFKAAFYRQLVPTLGSMLVSLVLAWFGLGVWALAIGAVAGVAATGVVVMALSGWRPGHPRFPKDLVRHMLHFGGHVSIQNVFTWASNAIDQIFVARFQSITNVGLFRTGSLLGNVPWTMVSGPFSGVVLPWFSRVDDKAETGRTYILFIRYLALLSIPLNVYVIGIVAPHTGIVLGQKWTGAAPVVMLFGLLNLFSCVFGVNGEVLKAIGRPEVATRLSLARIALAVVPFYLAARTSIYHLAAAEAALAWVTALAFTPVLTRILAIPWRRPLAACGPGIRTALPAIVVGAAWQAAPAALQPSIWSFVLLSAVAGSACLAVLVVYERELTARAIETARVALARFTARELVADSAPIGTSDDARS